MYILPRMASLSLEMKDKLVLVPFPFHDFSFVKVRPAICLTDVIGKFEHVVVAFISSNMDSSSEITDVVLDSDDDGFEQTGLKVSSVILLHKMVALPVNLIQRELGKLPPNKSAMVRNNLRILFNIEGGGF